MQSHHAAIDFHALLIAHELGGGVQRRSQSLSAQNRRGEPSGRRLAVGSRNLDAIEVFVGPAELIEHVDDCLKQRTRLTDDLSGVGGDCHRPLVGKPLELERHDIGTFALHINPLFAHIATVDEPISCRHSRTSHNVAERDEHEVGYHARKRDRADAQHGLRGNAQRKEEHVRNGVLESQHHEGSNSNGTT